MGKHNKQIIRLLIAAVLFNYAVLCAFLMIPTLRNFLHPARYIKSEDATVEISIPHEENGEADETILTLARGTEVRLRKTEENVSEVEYDGTTFKIDNSLLANSLEDAIDVDYVYPRRLINLREEKSGKLSDIVVEKGEAVKVVSVDSSDLNPDTGVISWYEVEKDGENYWISGSAVEVTEEAALYDYGSSITYSNYWDTYYGIGYSKDAYINQIDYKPVEKAEYDDNPLVTDINALHLTLANLVNNKDYYLELSQSTGINAYVVELKGDYGYLSYISEVPQNYLSNPDEALSNAYLTYEDLADLFKEFQDAGYYMIGRIVTFKDGIFAEQNPDSAMVYSDSGELVLHNEEYWPSPYSREMWQYTVDIAKEIAPIVNEIQFDYVRFPDGTLEANLDGEINFHNQYNESKVAALQGFLAYAKEELEPYHVYVAADLFAWPVVAKDDQDIGQFFPALANMVDVVSPMPYADHFSEGAMNIDVPTDHPQEVLYEFSTIVKSQLDSLTSAPVYRTWIMGYSPFDADDVKLQIKGINQAGYEGYMVWSGNGDFDLISSLQKGFIDSALKQEFEDTDES